MKRISKEENREDKRLMLERFKTIYMGGTGEIVEKKSRFIATVRLTETEEEALTFIEAVRKKYWNATHNCYAYVIGERKELVRAYSRAVQEGLARSRIIERQYGTVLEIRTDYNGIGKILYLIGQKGLLTLDSEYTDRVKVRILVPVSETDRVEKELVEATSGRVELARGESFYYADLDGKVLMGEELTPEKEMGPGV